MTIYITKEDSAKVKESYLNISHYALISVTSIFDEFNYDFDEYDEISQYSAEVINNRILDLIYRGIKIKRFVGIIYSNPKLAEENLADIVNKFNSIDGITKVVFLDNSNKEYRRFYKYFDEVSFYPSIKKITLVKAKKFDSKMFYWVNGIEDDDDNSDPSLELDK